MSKALIGELKELLHQGTDILRTEQAAAVFQNVHRSQPTPYLRSTVCVNIFAVGDQGHCNHNSGHRSRTYGLLRGTRGLIRKS